MTTPNPETPLPYLVGTGPTGNFAFYPSGAIRRIGNTELQRLRDELDIRTLGLSGTDQEYAATASKHLFNL